MSADADLLVEERAEGERLDASETREMPLVIFPSPSGDLFTQHFALELATEPHLVFACGRYEGIDERVVDYAASRTRVRKLSLGDYVLNGGEVATLAMIEAIGRLIRVSRFSSLWSRWVRSGSSSGNSSRRLARGSTARSSSSEARHGGCSGQ